MRVLHLGLVLSALIFGALSAQAQIILPPEPDQCDSVPQWDCKLNHTHVQFGWPKITGVDEYQLQVVIDNGSPDPFDSVTPVVDILLDGANHRAVVDSGITWDEDFAWRVRGITAAVPGAWETTYRFQTAAIPGYVPTLTVSTPTAGSIEDGLTLFNIRSPNGTIPNGLALAVDQAGDIVWFLEREIDLKITDIRLLDGDRMLYIASDRAWEVLLNGQLVWASPLDAEMRVHHEAFQMPNGNVLAVVHDYEYVNVETSPSVFEDQWWKGDRIVELNRANNKVMWEWSTWDSYSVLDFDATVMALPTTGPTEPIGGSYPHTHSNGAIYDPVDDSIYISARHISRVTKIDRATKQVVYHMGFEAPSMPSGDVDFGDDLFSWQHSPEMLPNGNMLLYDNGNRRGHVDATEQTGVSKVIELSFSGAPIDDATIVWEWTIPDYQRAVGDGDRLANGNTLVVAGVTGEIYEVTSAGDIVWQLELPTGSPDYLIYRAERIPYLISDTAARDTDGDTVTDYLDNCPEHVNVGQVDRDLDGFGDICARAYGVGIFALPSLSPIGFAVLIMVLVATAFAAGRTARVA